MPLYSCYINSCRQDSVVGRVHMIYGRVDCCATHDPQPHGYARDMFASSPAHEPLAVSQSEPATELSKEQLIAAMLAELLRLVKSDDGPSGGKKAKLVKPRPILPSGGIALRPGGVM